MTDIRSGRVIPDDMKDMDTVLLTLENLGHDLPLSNLKRLSHFNRTYLVITRNVRQARRAGKFDHPDFLDKFDARFAYYYLQALES